MTQLIQTINKVRKRINPNLKIDGVLITLADMQTKVGKTTFQTLQNSYGSKIKIYDTIIPQGVKAVEGTMAGKVYLLMIRIANQLLPTIIFVRRY